MWLYFMNSRKKISFLIICNCILGHRFIFQNVMREMSIPPYQMISCAHDSKIVHIKNVNHNFKLIKQPSGYIVLFYVSIKFSSLTSLQILTRMKTDLKPSLKPNLTMSVPLKIKRTNISILVWIRLYLMEYSCF